MQLFIWKSIEFILLRSQRERIYFLISQLFTSIVSSGLPEISVDVELPESGIICSAADTILHVTEEGQSQDSDMSYWLLIYSQFWLKLG